jgi:hypothetical protein
VIDINYDDARSRTVVDGGWVWRGVLYCRSVRYLGRSSCYDNDQGEVRRGQSYGVVAEDEGRSRIADKDKCRVLFCSDDCLGTRHCRDHSDQSINQQKLACRNQQRLIQSSCCLRRMRMVDKGSDNGAPSSSGQVWGPWRHPAGYHCLDLFLAKELFALSRFIV